MTNQIDQYENKVTYSWDGTDNPVYTSTNGKTGKLRSSHASGFTYYDEEIGDFITKPKEISGEITSLISTYYNYAGSTYLDSTTPAYKMIFRNAEDSGNTPSYWLASYCVGVSSASFGLGRVHSGFVGKEALVFSYPAISDQTAGCRVVVTLKPDIALVADGETGAYNIV